VTLVSCYTKYAFDHLEKDHLLKSTIGNNQDMGSIRLGISGPPGIEDDTSVAVKLFPAIVKRNYSPEDLKRRLREEEEFDRKNHAPFRTPLGRPSAALYALSIADKTPVEVHLVYRHDKPALPSECNACGKQNSFLMLCGGCANATYCNMNCQRKDWPKHNRLCNWNTHLK